MIEVPEYLDPAGRSPFGKWVSAINVNAAAKVATALERMSDGNLSNVSRLAAAYWNIKLILVPDIASISVGTVTGL